MSPDLFGDTPAAPRKRPAPIKFVPSHATRESWLTNAVVEIAALVFAGRASIVNSLPEHTRVTCGWPSSGGRGSAKRTIGECWPRARSERKVNEIFISPTLRDPVQVLDVLTHELVHAQDDCASKHGAAFKKMAKAVGLTGKATATVAGPELRAILEGISKNLGEYPHGALDGSKLKKTAKTYLLKCTCTGEDCGAVFRITAKWVDKEAGLTCPVCQSEVSVDWPEDADGGDEEGEGEDE